MAKTQVKGQDVLDGSVSRVDLNTTDTGKSVVRRIVEAINTGVKIFTSTGVDSGTGDVALCLDMTYLNTIFAAAASAAGWNLNTVSQASQLITSYNALYNWNVVGDSRGIAPSGWHIPSAAELTALSTALGGDSVAGGHLKEIGLTSWITPNAGADNSSGFCARGIGWRDPAGTFWSDKQQHNMWSTTSCGGGNYFGSMLTYNAAVWYPNGATWSKTYGAAIRLIKDDSNDPGTMTDKDGNVYQTVKIGTQVWMKQDLMVTHFNNGDLIPLVTGNSAWAAATTTPAMCYYANTMATQTTQSPVPIVASTGVNFKDSASINWVLNAITGGFEVFAHVANNAINYARFGTEFKGDLTNTSNAIDWATGMYAEITLTANTTFTFVNLEKGKSIIVRMTGAFVPTLPSSCIILNGGTYTGAKWNSIIMTCVNSVTPKVLISINTEP